MHNFLYSRVIGWELMSCAVGARCRNRPVNRAQNQLITYIFSIPVSLVGSSHVMCSRSLVSTPQRVAGTKPAHDAQFSLFPRHWRLGAHVMWSRAWCRSHKVTGCRNQLTTHNIYFLHPCVIGFELMSGALGAWPRNHKMNR